MSKMIRVLVPIDSQTSDAFTTALAYAKQICEVTGSSDVVLLTHTKNQLDHTSLARVLGASAIKALAKGPVKLPWGGALRTETMRTIGQFGRSSVLIVYYADPSILDFVDGLRAVIGVVAVPDLPGTASDWARRWNAKVHGEQPNAPVPLITDSTVVRALESLTKMVNLSTGIGNHRDKSLADETLRILRAKGHSDPSANIKSWAITNGWRPGDSIELEALSRKIWSLKSKPSLSSIYNANERYGHWQTEK